MMMFIAHWTIAGVPATAAGATPPAVTAVAARPATPDRLGDPYALLPSGRCSTLI
jgi:hypothetical protein